MGVATKAEGSLDVPIPNRRGEFLGLARGLARVPTLLVRRATVPRGHGAPVLVLPGLLTGDGSTAVLRRWLVALGHDAQPWALGFNDGRLARLVPAAAGRLLAVSRTAGAPVRLVGWSLGGVIARELARLHPEAVDRIVTMGTPVVGGPKYTSARWIYERRGLDLDVFERRVHERNQTRIEAPITAIYSRKDAVVAWQACLDPNPQNDVEHVEVDAYHSELGSRAHLTTRRAAMHGSRRRWLRCVTLQYARYSCGSAPCPRRRDPYLAFRKGL